MAAIKKKRLGLLNLEVNWRALESWYPHLGGRGLPVYSWYCRNLPASVELGRPKGYSTNGLTSLALAITHKVVGKVIIYVKAVCIL